MPSQSDGYLRPEVAQFAREMERRLRANDHKGGWTADEPAALLARLRQEADELDEVIDRVTGGSKVPLGGSMASPIWWKVIEEAADVANFALMIADLAARGGLHGLKDLAALHVRFEEARDAA